MALGRCRGKGLTGGCPGQDRLTAPAKSPGRDPVVGGGAAGRGAPILGVACGAIRGGGRLGEGLARSGPQAKRQELQTPTLCKRPPANRPTRSRISGEPRRPRKRLGGAGDGLGSWKATAGRRVYSTARLAMKFLTIRSRSSSLMVFGNFSRTRSTAASTSSLRNFCRALRIWPSTRRWDSCSMLRPC